MSWSVNAVGKGEAVSRSLAQQFEAINGYKMAEPEASAAAKIGEALVAACAAIPNMGVIVKGYGSQCSTYDPESKTQVPTGLNMSVTLEAYPFVE